MIGFFLNNVMKVILDLVMFEEMDQDIIQLKERVLEVFRNQIYSAKDFYVKELVKCFVNVNA